MVSFDDIRNDKNIYLYCGNLPNNRRVKTRLNFIGLSLHVTKRTREYTIQHDLTKPLNLRDNTVDIVQSEDVFEHIDYSVLPSVINEIYRCLKPNGLFRLSIPDYRCDILFDRTEKHPDGTLRFDPGGGGSYDDAQHKVVNGGHVWFPTHDSVRKLLETSDFKKGKIEFLHYTDSNNVGICHPIDYSKGYIQRTPDHDERTKNPRRPFSIVVDCYKD